MSCYCENQAAPGTPAASALLNAKQAFVRAIEEELKRRGLSRSELARMLACTETNLSQILDERRPGIRLQTAERLAEALGYRLFLYLAPNSPDPRGRELLRATTEQIVRWEEAARREGLPLQEFLVLAIENSAANKEQLQEPALRGGGH